MVRVTYVEASGTRHEVDLPAGISLMRGATDNDLPSILADCGGNCTCGTCRVHVPPEWRVLTGTPSGEEEAILDIEEGTGEGLRLSCQIQIRPDLNGLIVHLPERQF